MPSRLAERLVASVEEVVRRYFAVVADLGSTVDNLRPLLDMDLRVVEYPNAVTPHGAVRSLDDTVAGFLGGKKLQREQEFDISDARFHDLGPDHYDRHVNTSAPVFALEHGLDEADRRLLRLGIPAERVQVIATSASFSSKDCGTWTPRRHAGSPRRTSFRFARAPDAGVPHAASCPALT